VDRPVLGLGLAAAVAAAAVVTAPAGVAGAVSHVSLTGRWEALAADGNSDRVSFEVSTGGRHYVVRPPAGVPAIDTGAVVSVDGTVDRGAIDASRLSVVGAAPAVVTTGTQSVYVIRAFWTVSPTTPTTSDVNAAFTSASAWFDEVSYGTTTLATTVGGGWRSVPAPSDCSDTHINTVYADALTAETTATPGFDPAAYDHVAVYFPAFGSCSWAGLGTIGGSKVWLNGDESLRVTTHEIGHNLGLWHSHALDCYTDINHTTQTAVSNTCGTPDDYGDPSDVMGGGDLFLAPDYSASQKAQLGWLPGGPANVAPCTQVVLPPYEVVPSGGGHVAAAIDAGLDPVTGSERTYWLEYRHPPTNTVDSSLPAGLTDGVLLHETDEQSLGAGPNPGPDLLDGTPGSAGGQADFDDAAIASGTVTNADDGISLTVGTVDASGATVDLGTSRPSVPRSLTASRGTTGVTVSWTTPTCKGGGGSSITGYDVTKNAGSAIHTSSTSLLVGGLPGQAGATYTVSATNNVPTTGPAAVVPTSAPVVTTAENFSGFSTLHFTPSVSDGGHTITGYLLHGEPVNGASAISDNFYDVTTRSDLSLDLIGANGSKYVATIQPVFADGSDGPASTPLTFKIGDAVAPTVSVIGAATTLAPKASFSWSATDSGAGVKDYSVRNRVAPYNGTFGSYASPTALQNTTTKSASFAIAEGSTVCASVLSRDNNLNISGRVEKCAARPLDDRALHADTNWVRGSDPAAYDGTVTSSSHKGATLTMSHVNGAHLSVLVTECSTCGKVTVLAGTKTLATLDLHASTTKHEVVLSVPLGTALSGATVKLVVATSGAPVKIDGLVPRAK
jgi:hypothetical protein